MKNNKEFISNLKNTMPYGIVAFMVIIASLLVYFTVRYWSNIIGFLGVIINVLQPVIIGVLLAYLINPIVNRAQNGLTKMIGKKHSLKFLSKYTKSASIFFGYFIVFLFFYFILNLVIPGVKESVSEIMANLPAKLTDFSEKVNYFLRNNRELENAADTAINELSNFMKDKLDDMTELYDIGSKVFTGLTGFVYFVFNIVIGIIVSMYVLSEKDNFIRIAKKIIYAIFPIKVSNNILKVSRETDRIFSGFIMGKIIDSIIIGMLCYIIMLILRLPYAALISVIVGLTNVIPFFGPFIGGVPSALIILLTDPKKGVIFIILIIVLQQIEGNVIEPKVLGSKMGLSSFWIVFAILLSGGLFGFAGLILGVPIFAVIYYVISAFVRKLLISKELPADGKDYSNLIYIDQTSEKTEFIYEGNKENLVLKKNQKDSANEEE